MHTMERSSFPEGKWLVETRNQSGFVVARTDTYPEMVHPPSSQPGSTTAPSYIPADKPALIAATTHGPGGMEPLLLDGTTPLKPLTADEKQRWTLLQETDEPFFLQVGADVEPLQVRREFRLVPLKALPSVQPVLPNCVEDHPCTLTVQLEPGIAVTELQASVIVADTTTGAEQPIYTHIMVCEERQCVDDGFVPLGDHTYIIRYLLSAQSNGVIYGDWAETTLTGESQANIEQTSVIFPDIPFDPSPAFRIQATTMFHVNFSGQVFSLTPEIVESTCPQLQMRATDPEIQADGRYRVGLSLSSDGPLEPQTCRGTFKLESPAEQQHVQPKHAMEWSITITRIGWELMGAERAGETVGDMIVTPMGYAGERGQAVLLVRYTGVPPFELEMTELNASQEAGPATIDLEDIEWVTPPVEGVVTSDGIYRVPVELVARRTFPHNRFWGSWYYGSMHLKVAGLSGQISQHIPFRLQCPGIWQRFIQPPIKLVYGLPLPGAITIPLSVVLPLVTYFVLHLRRRDAAVHHLLAEKARQQHHPLPTDPEWDAQPLPPSTLFNQSAGGTQSGNQRMSVRLHRPANRRTTSRHPVGGTSCSVPPMSTRTNRPVAGPPGTRRKR